MQAIKTDRRSKPTRVANADKSIWLLANMTLAKAAFQADGTYNSNPGRKLIEKARKKFGYSAKYTSQDLFSGLRRLWIRLGGKAANNCGCGIAHS